MQFLVVQRNLFILLSTRACKVKVKADYNPLPRSPIKTYKSRPLLLPPTPAAQTPDHTISKVQSLTLPQYHKHYNTTAAHDHVRHRSLQVQGQRRLDRPPARTSPSPQLSSLSWRKSNAHLACVFLQSRRLLQGQARLRRKPASPPHCPHL